MKKLLEILRLKWAEYLLEIIAVIIGILGAFSLDNWNEERKDRLEEEKILKEINSNLISGIAILNENIMRDSLGQQSTLIVLNHLKDNIPYHDSLSRHFMTFSNNPGLGQLQASGFASLKSKGLHLIRNDSIRIKLTNLYENTIPLLQEAYIYDVDERRRAILNTELYDHFMITDKLFGDSINGRVPIDYEVVLNDQRFESMVRSIADNRRWIIGVKQKIILEMEILILDSYM